MQKGDASRAAKKIELKRKRKASAAKKSKRKYRALDEAKSGSAANDLTKNFNLDLQKDEGGTAQHDEKRPGPA